MKVGLEAHITYKKLDEIFHSHPFSSSHSLPIVTAHYMIDCAPFFLSLLMKPSTTNFDTSCANLFIIRFFGSDPFTSLQHLKLAGFLSREEKRNVRASEGCRNRRGWRRRVSPILRRHSRRTLDAELDRDVRIPTGRFRIRIGSDGNKSNISRIYNIFAFHSIPIKSQFEISLPLSDYIQRVHGTNCLI